MGVFDQINKVMRLFRKEQKGTDVEMYVPGTPETMKFVLDKYTESQQKQKPLLDEWKRNRDAYDGDRTDMVGGKSAVKTDGRREIFNSTLVSTETETLVANRLAGSPRIFPKPVVDLEGFYEQLKDDDTAAIIKPMLESGRDPQEIVEAFWQVIVDNMMEEHKVHDLYFRLNVDTSIEGLGQVTPIVYFNEKAMDYDVKSVLVRGPDVLYDPSALYEEDLAYFFVQNFKRLAEARMAWPDFADKIHATEEEGGDQNKSRSEKKKEVDKVKMVTGYFRDYTMEKVPKKDAPPQYQADETTGALMELAPPEEWRRKYPNGRRFVFIPELNLMLEDKPNPYPWLPITLFAPVPVSTSIYGRAIASYLRPLQALHSQFLQQLFANVKLCGNPKGYATTGAITNPENINNEIGGYIMIDGNLSRVQPPHAVPIVGDIEKAIYIVEQMAKKITGVFEASRGGMPGSGTSGRAVLALQSGAALTLSPARVFFGLFMQEEWKKNLELAAGLYKRGRPLRVKEEDDVPPVLPFDLSAVTQSIDVEVSDDTHLPTDPQGRLEMTIGLLNAKDGYGVPIVDAQWAHDFNKIPGKAKLRRRLAAQRAALSEQQMQGAKGVNAPQINQSSMPQDTTRPALTENELATEPATQM